MDEEKKLITQWTNALNGTPYTNTSSKADLALWNQAALHYDSGMGGDACRHQAYIQALYNHNLLNKDTHIVDIGCGTGSLSLLLSSHCGRIDAIDQSAPMVNVCRQKLDHITTAHVCQAAFSCLSPHCCDLAIAAYNPATYLPEAFCRLTAIGKSGGLFSVNSGPSQNPLRQKLRKLVFGEDPLAPKGMDITYPHELLKLQGVDVQLSFCSSRYQTKQTAEQAIKHYCLAFSSLPGYLPDKEETIRQFIHDHTQDGYYTEPVEYRTGILTWRR